MSTDNTPPPLQEPPVDVNLRVGQYVQLRDLKKAVEERHKEELEPIKTAMAQLEALLAKALSDNNVDRLGTKNGTAHLKTQKSASVSDMETFWAFVVATGAFDLVDKKANVTGVEEYIKIHGTPPPGVSWNTIQKVGVLRK